MRSWWKRCRWSARTWAHKRCASRRWRTLPFDCRRQRDPNRRSPTWTSTRAGRRCMEFHRPRRPHECGCDRRSRNWQTKPFTRRRRWRQDGEFTRPRRQEEQRRSRRRRKARAGKHEHGLPEIDELIRRRRRHAEVVIGEIRRRFGRGGQHFEAPAGIPDVWTVGIAAQIRPVSRRGVCHDGAAPDDFLAAHRNHRSDARGIGTARIDGEELLVSVDGIALERRGVCVVDVGKIADRFAAYLSDRHDVRRRRCIGGAFSHEEWAVDL
jgi:hypothetical protein